MQNQLINNFYTVAKKDDFARNNLYRITAISSGTTAVNFTENDFLYLTTANVPGKTINNVVVPFMGMNFNVPGTTTYPNSNAWNVTFRCNKEFNIRKLLENWSFGTFSDASSNGNYLLGDTGTLDMELYQPGGGAGVPQKAIGYTLEGVYCVTIGDMAFDTTATGAVVTCQATLAYQYWRSSRSQ